MRHVLAAATRAAVLVLVLVTVPLSTAANAVIGGHDAIDGYPFVASLQTDGAQLCGGSLVAAQWVLTAGHCADIAQQLPGNLQLRIGSLDRTRGGTVIGVAKLVIHPAFGYAPDGAGPDEPSVTNDIALIKLDRPVPQQPVRIALRPGPVGTPTRILGWGCTHDHTAEHPCDPNQYPQRLQQLDTHIAPDSRCTDITPGRDLCTEAVTGSGQACAGDSGGPQIRHIHGQWALFGIASRPGTPAATPCSGTVVTYTDATAYRRWIVETTSDNT